MTHDISAALTGISGILVTPFTSDDKLDPARQGLIVDRAIAAGIHILVANGNTGEYYGLTCAEAETMVAAAAEHIDGRIPLIAGVGRSVGDACTLAKASRKAGADALMIHQPPDPFSAPRGFVDYIKAVDEAADGLPLVLYLRNDAIGLDTIAALCAMPTVKGVKWATPNPMMLEKCISAIGDDVVWVGGLAETWAPVFYSVGARGFTSGLINIWPERSMAIHAALEQGNYATANTLIAEMKAFEDVRAEELNGTNVTGVKAALQMIGHDCGPTRPPSAWPLTERQSKTLQAFVARHDLTL